MNSSQVLVKDDRGELFKHQNSNEDLHSNYSSSAMGAFEFPENRFYSQQELISLIEPANNEAPKIYPQMSEIQECHPPEMEPSPCKIARDKTDSIMSQNKVVHKQASIKLLEKI